MKNSYKILIFYIVLIAVILIAATAMFNRSSSEKLIYSDIVTKFKNEEVKVFELDDTNTLTLKTQDGQVYTYRLRDISIFYADLGDLIADQHERGIITDYDYPAPIDIPWWVSLIPYVIIIVLMIALWIYVMNQATGRGGASRMFAQKKL